MKAIILERNKNYLRPILSLIIIILVVYFGVIFFLNPTKHISFLLRTKESVVVFSMFGIIFSLLGIFIILKSILRKNAFLKVDNEGIYDGFSFYNNKYIKWEEVKRIETIRHNYNNYIAIFINKSLNKENGLSYILYKINELSMGTPYIISSGYLKCSFKYLEKTIND
jgi:hypothetical protein